MIRADRRGRAVVASALLMGAIATACGQQVTQESSRLSAATDPDGTVRMSGVVVRPSSYASEQARQDWIAQARAQPAPTFSDGIKTLREYYQAYNDAIAERMKALYPVSIEHRQIGGVRVESITPKDGVTPANKRRVLINLHGGAFTWGEGSGGEAESIPIASIGRIRVITVAYRLGPEHAFPAASEDVAAVYSALLREYEASQIGIYGTSAGGILTAQTIAWLDRIGLPRPAAIGMFCGAGAGLSGDSSYIAPALVGTSLPDRFDQSLPYFSQSKYDLRDPLVYPVNSTALLARFPPSLLLTGGRDFAMSAVLQTHRELIKQGVPADLHVWDGLPHSFFVSNPDLPESKEAYDVIVRFFDKHLR